MSRKQIAFLTISDARDKRSWSGTLYFMAQAMERLCGDVEYIGPLESRLDWLGKLINRGSLELFGKQYDYTRAPWFAKNLAKQAAKKLRGCQFDYIVAPAAASAIAWLDGVDIPIVFVSDTTFVLVRDYYHGFSGYLDVSVRDGNDLAARAMRRSRLVLFPTEWAAASALNDYAIDPARVHVIPFGANLEHIPGAALATQRRRSGKCKLLFLGVDWERKGGNIAYETLLHLESDHNIRAELTICGCNPPEAVTHERVNVIGFLNKQDPDQAEKLVHLFEESDYLLLPTRSECYGMVFCEASAYGVPSISTDTGGVSGVVAEGRNGYLLPESARGADYARLIARIEASDEGYATLAKSCRQEYDSRLNWDVWARRLDNLISDR